MTKKKVDETSAPQPVDLPTLLYRCPGPHARAGGTFGYRSAATDKEYASLIEAGYLPTLPEAVERYELDKKTTHK